MLPCQCLPCLGVFGIVPTQLFEGNELLHYISFLGDDIDIVMVVVIHEFDLSSINLQLNLRMRRPCVCVAFKKRVISSANKKYVMTSCLTLLRFLLVSRNPSSSSRPSIACRSA